VVIQIKASGFNHAEVHMRRCEWAEAAKIVGIKGVGLVKACPGGEFAIGAKVAALMGGYLCASRFQTRERRIACPNQNIMMS
jgi:NADPH:quinone reductase